MAERETLYTLEGQVGVDDACPGWERTGGKGEKGSKKLALLSFSPRPNSPSRPF